MINLKKRINFPEAFGEDTVLPWVLNGEVNGNKYTFVGITWENDARETADGGFNFLIIPTLCLGTIVGLIAIIYFIIKKVRKK